ncbi:MAG TPA: DNA polymerase domain-containing protein, partial [Leptospiraceae bacterium]|nr:DNA polymerase domain-containing protein [Leptospiraceae bacterium]
DLLYEKFASELKLGNIEWQDLLIRKTAGKSLEEYEMDTGTSLSMQELQEYGIEIQAGEKVKYVVVSQKNKNKSLRYLSEEKALAEQNKNAVFDLKHYEKLLMNAFEEVWQYFAYPEYFQEVRERQKFILFA